MNQINLPLTEDIFDFFKKNLDPDALRDRINQAARTRDAAREAAQIAEKKGNQALADQLNQDADNLQRLIDETIAQANSVQRPTQGGSSTGSPKADNDAGEGAPAESSEEAEDTEEPTSSGEQNQEDDEGDEDSMSDSKPGSDSEADEDGDSDSDNSSKNTSSSSQINKQNSSENASQNASADDGSPESDETDEAGADSDFEDEMSDQANNFENDENTGSSGGDGEGDEYNDEEYDDDGEAFADSDSDEENDFGPPKIEDKKILQNPFMSNQIPTQLPKDLQQQITDGELEIESEEDAIVRIISKLSGDARRGAEKALRDIYEQIKPSWWGAIDEG